MGHHNSTILVSLLLVFLAANNQSYKSVTLYVNPPDNTPKHITDRQPIDRALKFVSGDSGEIHRGSGR